MVTLSSATMAFSGRMAPMAAAMESSVIAPVGRSGRASGCSDAVPGFAPTASASAASAPAQSCSGVAMVVNVQSSWAIRLGMPG